MSLLLQALLTHLLQVSVPDGFLVLFLLFVLWGFFVV